MEQTKHLYSFFSNHLDVLSYLLNNHLFTISSQPFDRRWVIVPNTTFKYWLKNKLSTLNKQFLSMGVSIISLEEFFKEVFHLFTFNDRTKKLFLTDNLLPYIYKELNYPFQPDVNSFQTAEESSGKLTNLTYPNMLSLMSLFKKYYFYNIIKDNNPNWQMDLWNKIKKNFYSIKEVFSLISDFLSKQHFSCSLFFFCFEYFFNDLLYFIDKTASFISIFTYHLSPCAEFWGDIISDQQISYIQTKFYKFNVNKREIKEWVSLVNDRHPLLANLGQLEKKCFNQIESLDPVLINEYIFSNNKYNLGKIQNDILNLAIPSEILNDDSISIHVCNNIRREVEVLFNNITQLIVKENPLLSDIFISVPNIALYEPYLSTIFLNIPLNILGKNSASSSLLLEKILLIKDLFKNNLCFNSVLSLFSSKDFLLHMNLDEEEASFLLSWLKTHPFFYNKEKQASWQISLNNLIEEYPNFNQKNINNYFELIGKINLWLVYLQEALDKIQHFPHQTLLTWFHEISSHLNALFYISEEEQHILTSLEKSFSDQTNFITNPPLLFELSFFLDILVSKISLKKEEIKHPFIKNTIHCGLLKDLSFLPKKFFFILGMHLHSSQELLSMEELNAFHIPSEIEKENQWILNALITTQNQLTISYVSNPQTQNPPSFGVDEIKKYINETKIFHHPNKNYSYKYFSSNTSNLQLDTIHQDLSYLYVLSSKNSKQELNAPDFFSQHNSYKQNEQEPSLQKNSIQSISLKNLFTSLNNPLHHFLSSKFNNFSLKKHLTYSHPRFFITEKEKNMLRNKFLELNNSFFSDKHKLFLSSQFSRLVKEEKMKIFALLNKQYNNLELQKITFSNNCIYPAAIQETTYLPPINVNINKITVSITGTIFGILDDTLLILEELSLSSLIKALPSVALLKHAAQEYKEIKNIKKINFLSKSISIENINNDYLLNMINYYLHSQKQPSPLLLEWLPHILNSDEKKLQQAINTTIKNSYKTPLFSAIFNLRNPPLSPYILEKWSHEAKKLFPMWEDMK